MDKREQAMNAAIKEAYLRQHGALRGGKQYSTDEQYQLVFQRGYDAGHAAADDVRRQIADELLAIANEARNDSQEWDRSIRDYIKELRGNKSNVSND